ncbi:hypothetical protein [Microbacterium galbinum]|uniref:hypothetical protein n=1 Tax=Microbacterium galbinum TaxID=2851646 RepID=UPI001FFD9831|nr:hypothetical protein [Microbacterium galbinum]MCK2030330.1 hypothetical protein [Microbacterium galbinum]
MTSRRPESPWSITISVALVLSVLASMVLAFMAIAWYAFGRSEPLAYVGYGIASVVTAIVVPFVAIVAWHMLRRTSEPTGSAPPSSPRWTAVACLPIGCLVTAGWVLTIMDLSRSV